VGKFLAPNSIDITGADLFVNTLDKVPAVSEFFNPTDSGKFRPFSEKINLNRFSAENWTQTLSYDPDAASNALTFTNSTGTKLVFADAKASTATSDSSSVSFDLTGPTTGSNKLDKLKAAQSFKNTWTNADSSGKSTENIEDGLSYSFTDSNNTAGTTDDINLSVAITSKETANNSTTGIGSSTYAGTYALKYAGVGIAIDATATDSVEFAWSADGMTKELAKSNIKYSFGITFL
jgi:hypothetical protein